MTSSILRNNYIMKNTSVLKSKRFQRVKLTDEGEIYTYIFPVYKFKNNAILECRLMINAETGFTFIDVFDVNGTIYPPFYNDCYAKNLVLKSVNQKVLAKLKQLGIEKGVVNVSNR